MEPTDRDQVKIAKKEFRGSVTAERVATIVRKIKENRTEMTYTAEAFKEINGLQEQLRERDAMSEQVENAHRGEINRLQQQLQERDAMSEQVENAHRGEINRLQQQLQERDAMSEQVENALRGEINRLQEQLRERDRVVRDLEGTVRHLRLINRATGNVRDTTINQIQERDRDARNNSHGARVTFNVFGRRIFERDGVRLSTEGIVSLAAVTVAVGVVWWYLS